MILNALLYLLIVLMLRSNLAMLTSHVKCRNGFYPRSTIQRFPVPDDLVPWTVPFINYKPPFYTSPAIKNQSWADPDIGDVTFKPKWNALDDKVNRASYTGIYTIFEEYPLNPIGRTGLTGRGVLGRWGPNHAADPVVTRWKRSSTGQVESKENEKPILQVVAIQRGDTGEWALPGGMVDPGERVTAAAIREFQEEATNSLQMTKDKKEAFKQNFEKFFSGGTEVYKGYVDDHRNTDNAWIETVAYNFHDEDGHIVGGLDLKAGDDAKNVRWVDVTPNMVLYASHKQIVQEVYKLLTSDNLE